MAEETVEDRRARFERDALPFLYGGVVQEYGWLTDRQFVDAVAVAMITPGPVVITVAFIGYLVTAIWLGTWTLDRMRGPQPEPERRRVLERFSWRAVAEATAAAKSSSGAT